MRNKTDSRRIHSDADLADLNLWDKRRLTRKSIPEDTRLPFGHLTIVERDLEPSASFGSLSNGWYLARCDCGNPELIRLHARHIRAQAQLAWSCANPEFHCKSKRAELGDRRGRPPFDLAGQKLNRLSVGMFERGVGWEALCDCGEIEIHRNSRNLLLASIRPCPHRPGTGGWRVESTEGALVGLSEWARTAPFTR